ncbi:CoA transferase [Cupriavidus sp. D39]|uniref:CoA transferase n=1 Tax=Cupriavidus sp. D39 TaxID=2997877 RepID=UPI00226FCFE7|nr:CoA transferase [Cupriavidus sp. D39]MCY0853455.1 CoA transferase [Cupriavidus sp. D39]
MFNQTYIEELPVREAPAQPHESAVSGLKVVDFSHFIAGPLATMILGDFGADVIKIERPGRGEDFRYYPHWIRRCLRRAARTFGAIGTSAVSRSISKPRKVRR